MIYHDGGDDFNGLDKAVRKAYAELKGRRDEFDSIVVTGVSGQAVGFPLALKLKKPIVVLRKDGEDSHSGPGFVNGRNMGQRVLFLDDFISDRGTFERCKNAVEQKGTARIVASYLYRGHVWVEGNYPPKHVG